MPPFGRAAQKSRTRPAAPDFVEVDDRSRARSLCGSIDARLLLGAELSEILLAPAKGAGRLEHPLPLPPTDGAIRQRILRGVVKLPLVRQLLG
jgi:hypothetical protein